MAVTAGSHAASHSLRLWLWLHPFSVTGCHGLIPSEVLLQRHHLFKTAGDSAARSCRSVHPLRQLTHAKLVAEAVAEMAAVMVQLQMHTHASVNVRIASCHVRTKIKLARQQERRQSDYVSAHHIVHIAHPLILQLRKLSIHLRTR